MAIDHVKKEYLGIQWPKEQAMPSPREEIDRDEFDRLFHCGSYEPTGTFYHQLWIDDKPFEGPIWEVRFWWFCDYALAVAIRYSHDANHLRLAPETSKGHILPNGYGDGYQMRYFRFGCRHPNKRDEGKYMFEHKWVCPDCRWTHTYDSSD